MKSYLIVIFMMVAISTGCNSAQTRTLQQADVDRMASECGVTENWVKVVGDGVVRFEPPITAVSSPEVDNAILCLSAKLIDAGATLTFVGNEMYREPEEH